MCLIAILICNNGSLIECHQGRVGTASEYVVAPCIRIRIPTVQKDAPRFMRNHGKYGRRIAWVRQFG